jgi:uncharacterized protein
MLFNSDDKNHEDIYKKLLSDKLSLNLGYLYENAVAQMLVSSNRKLYYFTSPKKDSTKNYEIDFLFNDKNKISPLEVKSSNISKHGSIDVFGMKYSKYINQKYLVSDKDYFKDKELTNLPYYLLPFLLNRQY